MKDWHMTDTKAEKKIGGSDEWESDQFWLC